MPTWLVTILNALLLTGILLGVRLFLMQYIQEKRQKANRQLNERLKSLLAAYRALGGSFTATGPIVLAPAIATTETAAASRTT